MVDAIPGLINAIQMIQSVSLYYNTSEKISSLFVKVGADSVKIITVFFFCCWLNERIPREKAIKELICWSV